MGTGVPGRSDRGPRSDTRESRKVTTRPTPEEIQRASRASVCGEAPTDEGNTKPQTCKRAHLTPGTGSKEASRDWTGVSERRRGRRPTKVAAGGDAGRQSHQAQEHCSDLGSCPPARVLSQAARSDLGFTRTTGQGGSRQAG